METHKLWNRSSWMYKVSFSHAHHKTCLSVSQFIDCQLDELGITWTPNFLTWSDPQSSSLTGRNAGSNTCTFLLLLRLSSRVGLQIKWPFSKYSAIDSCTCKYIWLNEKSNVDLQCSIDRCALPNTENTNNKSSYTTLLASVVCISVLK